MAILGKIFTNSFPKNFEIKIFKIFKPQNLKILTLKILRFWVWDPGFSPNFWSFLKSRPKNDQNFQKLKILKIFGQKSQIFGQNLENQKFSDFPKPYPTQQYWRPSELYPSAHCRASSYIFGQNPKRRPVF